MSLLEIEKYLRRCGIKVTKGRLNILDILSKSDSAMSAECIFEHCKIRSINVDLSTIYRSLELFENKQLIRKFDLGQGKYSYSIRKESHKHILQCKLCHKQVEIDCPLQEIEELVKSKTGFVFAKEELNFKLDGICENCRKEK